MKRITISDYKRDSEYGKLIDLYNRTRSAVRFQRTWREHKNKQLEGSDNH